MKTIRKHLFLTTLIIILIIIISILLLKIELNKTSCVSIYEETSIEKEEITNDEEHKACTIDIKGAVNNPGVYTSDCDKYVNDIISLAGGLTEEADTSNVNLAKQITNEMVIVIRTKEDTAKDNTCQDQIVASDTTISNNLININIASLDELKKIPGIGQARAKAIIEYRNNNGNFKSISDITNVNGIGESLYEQIKIYITT